MNTISPPAGRTAGCSLVLFAAFAALLWVAPASWALDYLVQPVTPDLVKDKATTLLVDLSTKKDKADYAAGDPALKLDPAAFLADGGYNSAIGFATAGNFNPEAWTIEFVLRLRSDAPKTGNDPILSRWRGENEYEMDFRLSAGGGPAMRIYSWAKGDGMLVLANAGGNGFSIQRNAVGQWFYLACGFDAAGRRAGISARDMNGEVLAKNMNFAGHAQVNTDFLKGLPADKQAAELAHRWQALAKRIAAGLPPTLTFGDKTVDIRAIRISNVYRADVLDIAPKLAEPGETVWTPQALDPERVQTNAVTRMVGYPGYHNEVPIQIDESLLTLKPGDQPITITLKDMPISLYTFYIYGAVDAKGRKQLDRVWQPCPMEFKVKNAQGKVVAQGQRLLKQDFAPRSMQAFDFHADEPGNYTATFTIPARAMETPLIQKIVLTDQLKGLPDVAMKTEQTLAQGKDPQQLKQITPQVLERGKAIWDALPPLNVHLQVHGQVKEFLAPPKEADVPKWETKALVGVKSYYASQHTFAPLTFIDPKTKQELSAADIFAGKAWPGPFPDDGTGIFFSKKDYPGLTRDSYYTPRAQLLGERFLFYAGALMDSRGSFYGAQLPKSYFNSGKPEVGHDGALALVRFAYDWPALHMTFHEIRLSTHAPDFEYNTDWSNPGRRDGKMFYEGWSGSNTVWLFEAYDQVFPYIKDNQIFADEVRRFIPWVRTPEDVIRMLDRYLVMSSLRDFRSGLIRAASVEDMAGQLLGPSKYTAKFFDLTAQHAEIYPCQGTYQELYGTALSRSGSYYIASFMVYAFGAASGLIDKAYIIRQAREKGVELPMDLSDVLKYPKVKGAGDFLINMWPAGGFPFMIGDASGGPHTGIEAPKRLRMVKSSLEKAFALYGDPRHAWILKNMLGSADPKVAAAAEGVTDPILHAPSRVVPDYGAIVERGVDETDLTRKTAATLRLGIGQGHAHNDFLDLNFFAMGLPMAVDLACRDEGGFWSRPGGGWSFLHNHAIAHDGDDPRRAGGGSGEPWLRAFAPPLMRAGYVDSRGQVRLDRDVVLMQIGDTPDYYAIDVQRLSGDKLHTWCFHGCESDDVQINVPMADKTMRWIDRTLEGTHKVGTAADPLQATWTMTRDSKDYKYTFMNGGVIKTAACEKAVLGKAYDPTKPPVRVRVTLLGHAGDTVMQGNPYSQQYAYCFPFLWVQQEAKGESVYPAIYEWYRGDTPVVASAKLLPGGERGTVVVEVHTTSSQVDTCRFGADGVLATSTDAAGLRYVQANGLARVDGLPVTFTADRAVYQAKIVDIDYDKHTITTDQPLPKDPAVVIGNEGRYVWLQLYGTGASFTFNDDLLIQEGEITDLKVTGPDSIAVQTNQRVLFGDMGNRKLAALTQTNEDHTWQFRNGKVIRKPAGAELTDKVFTDANHDGRINLKTYEIGLGNSVSLPASVIVRRTADGYEAQTNVAVQGKTPAGAFHFQPDAQWQKMK